MKKVNFCLFLAGVIMVLCSFSVLPTMSKAELQTVKNQFTVKRVKKFKSKLSSEQIELYNRKRVNSFTRKNEALRKEKLWDLLKN